MSSTGDLSRRRNSLLQELCVEDYDSLENLRTRLKFRYEAQMLTLAVHATRLVRLEIPSSDLKGRIPLSVFDLDQLRILNLAHNKLDGELPKAVSNLQCLQILDLSGNDLSGPIPSSLGLITPLTKLDLGNNEFSGPLPGALRLLTNLRYVDLTQRGIARNIRQFRSRRASGVYAKRTSVEAVAEWRNTLPPLEADVAGGAMAVVSPFDSGGSGAFTAAFGSTASGGSPRDDGIAGPSKQSSSLEPPPPPPPSAAPQASSGVPSPSAAAAAAVGGAAVPARLPLPPPVLPPPPRLAATGSPSYASSSDWAADSSAATSTGAVVVGASGLTVNGSSVRNFASNDGSVSPAAASVGLLSVASSDAWPSPPAASADDRRPSGSGVSPAASGNNSVAGTSAAAAVGGGGGSEVAQWLRGIRIVEKRIPIIEAFLLEQDIESLSVLADMDEAASKELLAEFERSHPDDFKAGTKVALVKGFERLRRGFLNEEAEPSLLGGRYRDEEHHRTSKTAVVVFATDALLAPSDRALVTIKRFQLKALFERELSVLKHLNESVVASGAGGGVIALHSAPDFADTVDGRRCYHLVTRRATRGSLRDLLVPAGQAKKRSQAIETGEAFRFAIAAASIVAQVHAAGVVWAVLAPEHFLLVEQGRLAAIDFESSASITSPEAAADLEPSDREAALRAGLELHSTAVPDRIAPDEVRRCRSPYVGPTLAAAAARGEACTARPAHDVWCLGALLFLLASGRELALDLPNPPLEEKETDLAAVEAAVSAAVSGGVPKAWGRAVRMALRADPSDRESAAAVAAELRAAGERWAASEAVQASVAEVHGLLSGVQGNVAELVRGETGCPRLFLLLPPPEQHQQPSPSSLNLLARARAAMQLEMRLVFCCACGPHVVPCGPDGAGFVVKTPTEFARRYRPALQAGLAALRIAVQVGVAVATSGALHIPVPFGQLLPAEALSPEYASLFGDAGSTAERAVFAGAAALVGAGTAAAAVFASQASASAGVVAQCSSSGGRGAGTGDEQEGQQQREPQMQRVTADAFRQLVDYMEAQHGGWRGRLGNMAACASSGGAVEWVCPQHSADFQAADLPPFFSAVHV